MNEIHDSTTRVSTLVGAAKQYSQMDRAPFQVVDVHELLKSTLLMMSGKLHGIKVVKDFDRVAAADPRLRRRAQPGVDQPDRQRGRRRWAGAGTLTDPYRPRRRPAAGRDR